MRKIILALVLAFTFFDVQAAVGKECTALDMETGRVLLEPVSHVLEYASNYVDMNGDFEEGFMRIKFPNLPSGYKAIINTKEGTAVLNEPTIFAALKGGVYKIEFYSDACDNVIKSYEIRVPHYMQYCGKDIKCEDNPWFDGTFENSLSNQKKKPASKLSVTLIVILVFLIAMIALFIWWTIKRRKRREADL